MTRVLAIDPSSRALGYALSADLSCGRHLTPLDVAASGVLEFKSAGSAYVERVDHMLDGLETIGSFDRCIIEQPETWMTPKGTRASTSGAMLILGYTVGVIRQWARQCAGLRAVSLVTVREWKGQLPKRVTFQRLQDEDFVPHLRACERDFNESDAVGLLKWYAESSLHV